MCRSNQSVKCECCYSRARRHCKFLQESLQIIPGGSNQLSRAALVGNCCVLSEAGAACGTCSQLLSSTQGTALSSSAGIGRCCPQFLELTAGNSLLSVGARPRGTAGNLTWPAPPPTTEPSPLKPIEPTQTATHTVIHSHSHTVNHTVTHRHSHHHIHIHTVTHTHTQSQTHSHSQTQSITATHSYSQSHRFTHRQMHTITHNLMKSKVSTLWKAGTDWAPRSAPWERQGH